jgi:type VI secretion system secreted protein VgrG
VSSEHPLRYWIEIGGQSYEAREVRGREQVSTVFRIDASFVVDSALPPDPDALIKTAASIVLSRDDGGATRRIDGIITDVALGASIRGAPDLSLTIEPRLSLARHRTDVRVFRDKSVPDIVEEVLSQIGVKPERRLREAYEVRPYCVQFRESDLDFVSRLLEDEGIFYFFGEGDVMVLGDSPSAYEPIPGDARIPYRAGSGMDDDRDAVHTIGRRAALTVGKVSLRDWNPEHPSLDMDVEAPGPTPAGPEHYDYPGEYLEPSAGARKARLISESFACAAAAVVGRSFCARFAPGYTWKLEGAPEGVTDGEHVVIALEHDYARALAGYSNSFEALPGETTYRPPRATYVPRILNPVTAIVTGPAGADDIYTDAYGRVKVHFHWDRRLPPDDDCSHWVPVLQDNTGQSSAIPRIGWEVLVHFLEGDPDRPVILGRVYNAEDTFPVPLPARKTCTSLKSLSSPTRDGTNEIQLEDLAGKEYIWVHAERDQNIVVANNKNEHVIANESTIVRRNETIVIGNNHTAAVGSDVLPTVSGDQTWSTGASRRLFITGADTGNVLSNRSLSIGGMHHRRANDSDGVFATFMNEQIGGSVIESFGRSDTTEANRNMTRTIAGSVFETAGIDKTESTVLEREEVIAGDVLTKAGRYVKMGAKKRFVTVVSGDFTARSAKDMVLTGAEKISTVSATALFKGQAELTLKVGQTVVLLKGNLISIKAKSSIALRISGENEQGSVMSYQI